MKPQTYKTPRCFVRNLGILGLIILLNGCIETAQDFVVDRAYRAVSTTNGVSMNGVSMNGVSMNGVSMNGLLMRGVVRNGLESVNAHSLIETASGASLLAYLVQCALPAGEVLMIDHEMAPPEGFPGLLGVAPGWRNGSLEETGKRAMSACMLAHVNAYGVSVPISARQHGLDDTTEEERERFRSFEGAFFGNLFERNPVMLTCGGATPPDFSVPYPDHEKSDRLLRRCTDSENIVSDATLCGMTYVGRCSEICATEVGGSYRDCLTSSGTYSETMNTWLLDSSDAASAWPIHYDALYGPGN